MLVDAGISRSGAAFYPAAYQNYWSSNASVHPVNRMQTLQDLQASDDAVYCTQCICC